MHAGLASPALNRRYIQLVQRELMPVYCRELRHHIGLADTGTPVSEQEIEFVWNLHGGIFYRAMRKHVYRAKMKADFTTQVGYAVDTFLAGAEVTYPRLLQQFAPGALVRAPKKLKRVG
jgi:hypothetical protein